MSLFDNDCLACRLATCDTRNPDCVPPSSLVGLLVLHEVERDGFTKVKQTLCHEHLVGLESMPEVLERIRREGST